MTYCFGAKYDEERLDIERVEGSSMVGEVVKGQYIPNNKLRNGLYLCIPWPYQSKLTRVFSKNGRRDQKEKWEGKRS